MTESSFPSSLSSSLGGSASVSDVVPVVLGSTEGAAVSNQILLNFRRTVGGDRDALHFFSCMEWRLLRKGDRSFFSEAEQAHAERVLKRLIAFSAEPDPED